jgi:calcium-dependent protein kinase
MHRKTKERLAVKTISKKATFAKNKTLLKNEITLLQQIDHKNIVRVADVIQDEERIHIVMEECKGGDLFDRVIEDGVTFGERRAAEIIGSLLDAVAYLHDMNIVHRDLKVSR